MKNSVFSILDTKSGAYGPLICFQNELIAVRSFQEMICSGDKNSLLSLYPADYLLCCIGHFDNETGVITPLAAPSHIITGLDAYNKGFAELQARVLRQRKIENLKKQTFNDTDNVDDIKNDDVIVVDDDIAS